MEKKQVDKKFTWVINNFSSLESEEISSDKFVVGGCKWNLTAFPKGEETDEDYLSVFLEVVDDGTLLSGWRIHARCRLIVVNQRSERCSPQRVFESWFDEESDNWGYPSLIPLGLLHDEDFGFLVNGEIKIVVEVEILEVIGNVEFKGFQLPLSHAELVSRMFEKHPEIASEFRPKDPNIRAGYMSLLLGLLDTMRHSQNGLSNDVLEEARAALKSLTGVGFMLDWLEKQLDQVSEKKKKVKACEIRMVELGKQLKMQKLVCSYRESQIKKEAIELLAAKTALLVNDLEL